MKKRIISAIIMILIVVPLIYFGGYEYKIFMTALSLCGLWELFRLEDNVPKYVRYLFYIFDACLMFFKDIIGDYKVLIPLLSLLIILLSLSNIKTNNKRFELEKLLKCMALSFINIFLFYSLVNIRDVGLVETFYVYLVATFTDTFALLGGKYFGKHKLCPNISPNKTIEGSISGTIFGTLIGMITYLCFGPNVNGGMLLLVTFVLSIVCQLGDLFFSSIKRFYKVKDFSNLIPGHGGILDRFDGILFVASLFMLLIELL